MAVVHHVRRGLSLFRRLPFTVALRLLIARMARAVLRPGGQQTFSQFGEDIRLWTLLGTRRGFYVDVGCNDPIHFSNTFRLYIEGWEGIAVDGDTRMVERFRRMRPRDKTVHAVVSDREQDACFAEMNETCLSHLVPLTGSLRSPDAHRVSPVRTKTLDSILAGLCCPFGFELLTIDVEGHEYEVLNGFDIGRYQPRVVAVEIHGFNIHHPEESPVAAFLIENGYRLDSVFVPTVVFCLGT